MIKSVPWKHESNYFCVKNETLFKWYYKLTAIFLYAQTSVYNVEASVRNDVIICMPYQSQVFIFESLGLYHLDDPYQDENSTAWDNMQLHERRPGSVPE